MERPTELGEGETVVSIPALKTWVANLLFARFYSTKERLKSLVYTPKYILQYLAMDVFVLRAYFLYLNKLIGLVVVIQALASHAVSVSAFLQGGVVQLPATSEREGKQLNLLMSRNQSELVGNPRHVFGSQYIALLEPTERRLLCLQNRRLSTTKAIAFAVGGTLYATGRMSVPYTASPTYVYRTVGHTLPAGEHGQA
jgi:hypothetical protein